MATRTVIPSSRVWSKVGYSRAVRTGDLIEIAGTSPSGPDGKIMYPGDPYRQAKYVFDVILKAVKALGGDPTDVVRTRVFVTDITKWEEAGRAHYEAFGQAPPASAFYEVSALLHPELTIEVEATAIVGSGASSATIDVTDGIDDDAQA